MRRKKVYLFFLCLGSFCAGTLPAAGQSREIISFSAGYEGKARLKDVVSGGDASSVDMVETGARVNTPLYMGERFRLMSGVGFKHTHFGFYNAQIERQDVYTVSVPFRSFFDISSKWSFTGAFAPSVYSDFENVNGDDFKTAAFGLGFYKWRDDCSLAIGAAYSRDFGEDSFYPAIGLTWRPSDKWTVNMLWPRPAVLYEYNQSLQFFIFAMPAGGEWSISEEVEGGKKDFTLSLKGYRSGLGCSWNLWRRVIIHAEGGAMFLRDYELRDDDHKVFDSSIGDTWFLECGIGLQ